MGYLNTRTSKSNCVSRLFQLEYIPPLALKAHRYYLPLEVQSSPGRLLTEKGNMFAVSIVIMLPYLHVDRSDCKLTLGEFCQDTVTKME